MKKNIAKSFKDWEYEEVEDTFGLTRVRNLPVLDVLKTLSFDTNQDMYKNLI